MLTYTTLDINTAVPSHSVDNVSSSPECFQLTLLGYVTLHLPVIRQSFFPQLSLNHLTPVLTCHPSLLFPSLLVLISLTLNMSSSSWGINIRQTEKGRTEERVCV